MPLTGVDCMLEMEDSDGLKTPFHHPQVWTMEMSWENLREAGRSYAFIHPSGTGCGQFKTDGNSTRLVPDDFWATHLTKIIKQSLAGQDRKSFVNV